MPEAGLAGPPGAPTNWRTFPEVTVSCPLSNSEPLTLSVASGVVEPIPTFPFAAMYRIEALDDEAKFAIAFVP